MECFWANEVNCWEPGCGVDPTNVIYAVGTFSRSFPIVDLGDPGKSLNDICGIAATTATLVSVRAYYASDFTTFSSNCPYANWWNCLSADGAHVCGGGETVSAPPLGALYSTYAASYSFDPSSSSAVLALADEIVSVSGLSGATNPQVWWITFVAQIQTDVGIVSFPFCTQSCF